MYTAAILFFHLLLSISVPISRQECQGIKDLFHQQGCGPPSVGILLRTSHWTDSFFKQSFLNPHKPSILHLGWPWPQTLHVPTPGCHFIGLMSARTVATNMASPYSFWVPCVILSEVWKDIRACPRSLRGPGGSQNLLPLGGRVEFWL